MVREFKSVADATVEDASRVLTRCLPSEAIETLVWLVEIARKRDAQKLIQDCATIFEKDLFTKNITFQTTMDGRRQLRRYVPEKDNEGTQDLRRRVLTLQ